MSYDLQELLRRVGTSATGVDYTHEYTNNRSRYNVRKECAQELYFDYCKMTADGREDLHLSEKCQEVMPVIIKFNLKFDTATLSEPYDDAFIIHIVYHIQQIIVEYLNVANDDEDTLACCVLESLATDDPVTHISSIEIRFQFPNCRCDANFQIKALIPALIRRLRAKNVKSRLFHEPHGDWDKCIETDCLRNNLPMYKSRPNTLSGMMNFYNVYGIIYHNNQDDLDTHDDDVRLNDFFDPEQHSLVAQEVIKPEDFRFATDPLFWLPMILSVGYGMRVLFPRRAPSPNAAPTNINNSPNEQDRTVKYDLSKFARGEVDDIEDQELVSIFTDMWKSDRILQKHCWLSLGEGIYDAFKGEETGLRRWIEVTHEYIKMLNQTPSYLEKDGVEVAANKYYYTFRLGRTTIKTLAWHAREDSPANYETWHNLWCRKALEQATSGLHNDVARALYRVYWLEFMCTFSGKKTVWYKYDRHRLHENPNGYSLRQLISKDFVKRFTAMRMDISFQIHNSNNNTDQDAGENILNNIAKLITHLKTGPYKSNIINEAVEFFVDDDLESKLDDDPEIMGMPNGVLIATDECVDVRPGKPEDYITRSIAIPYRSDYEWNSPEVMEVMEWAKQTFYDGTGELMHHWFKFLASILRGGNNDKKFPVLSGEGGDNSKSMWVKAIECILGSYCVKVPVSLITGGRGDANGPSPAIARCRSTRISFLEEPNETVPIDASIVKSLTGSDSFFARMLKKNGGDIKPYFKFVMVCNRPPDIPNGGKAIRNRMAIYPFLGTWVDHPPATMEERYNQKLFQLDPFFDKRIPYLAGALLWIMIRYYPFYVKEGIRNEPQLVKDITRQYWEERDLYFQFAGECVEIVPGENQFEAQIEINALYIAFKQWYRDSYPTGKVPDRPTVKAEFSARWGRPIDCVWPGKRLKTAIFNVEDPDAGGGARPAYLY